MAAALAYWPSAPAAQAYKPVVAIGHAMKRSWASSLLAARFAQIAKRQSTRIAFCRDAQAPALKTQTDSTPAAAVQACLLTAESERAGFASSVHDGRGQAARGGQLVAGSAVFWGRRRRFGQAQS